MLLRALTVLTLSLGVGDALWAQAKWSFTCSAKPAAGVQALTPSTIYKSPATFGFDMQTSPTTTEKGSCSGDKPFFFSIAVPDGNYAVTLVLGSDTTASTTTVRGESRRLFVKELALPRRGSKQVTFNVHVRSATIYPAPGEAPKSPLPQVKLKPREIGALDWDEKLTLEFNGDHPSVRSITARAIADVPTVYLAGDSTVVDQDKEPWAAWGQMLPVFFGTGVSIANEAESGETIRSFVAELRYDKVMSTIKPGDFLLIQFAHNDQKQGANYVPAMTDYKDYMRRYIAAARSHQATPVLVTSMNRRKFVNGKIEQTLGEYPQAMREVAAEQKVALIDLNAMSKTLFEAMGEEGTLHAFVHYPANTFPGQTAELKDDTHFNSYGAYELARAIVQNIRDQQLPLAKFLRKDIPFFDPAHPDALSAWTVPPSPAVSTVTPYGR